MEFQEHKIDAGGIRTRFFAAGAGQPVILIHGSSLAIDARSTWYRTLPALAQQFSVLAPDLVGFGRTSVAFDGKHVPRLERVKHVADFIDALGIERYSLVGHSEGGFIAAKLAIERPSQVVSLCIVTSGATAPVFGDYRDAAWSAAAAAAYNVKDGCETVDDFIKTATSWSETFPTDFEQILRENYNFAIRKGQLERLKEVAQNGDYKNYNKIQYTHILPFLADVEARVLLVWAANDKTVPVERGHMLRAFCPSADMHVFASAAHMVMIDRSRDFNALMSNWL
jgi:pimeloyl-ACP methyl ester carboxylesterase